jgi:PAS domain S-box-containing protein
MGASARADAEETAVVKRNHADEQFRLLFEAAPNGLLAVDADGRIVLLNAQVEKMFGYCREDLIGQTVEMLVPPRLRGGHIDQRGRFAADAQMRPMGTSNDLLGVRKNGSEFPIEVGLDTVVTGIGDLVIAAVADVTERKRTEEGGILLENARARIEVCQQLGMPAAVLQHDGRVLLLNPLLQKLRSQFVLTGDRINLSNTTANELFLQAVACLDSAITDQIVDSIPVPAADDHPPLIFHLLPMKGSFGNTLGILVVTTLDALGVPSADLVKGLFALAPAEARVAALIGSGLSPRQAARRLDLSEGNVRTTLKHVFGKVGVSRQNELAVLLTKLALRRSSRARVRKTGEFSGTMTPQSQDMRSTDDST